ACLIALSLSPLLPRHLLSSSTADYPALDSLLCGSLWSDPIVRQRCLTFSRVRDAFGSYLDMFTISSCARLRSGMLLSSVKPCTSAPRMRVTQRNVSCTLSPSPPLSRRHLLSSSTVDYPALDSLLYGSPWRDPIAGF
ncbi:hypothetical protein B0H14DRAFT_2889817, partial [Mycena olivaceomarginata]